MIETVTNGNNDNLIVPYAVMRAASEGNIKAIDAILRYFEGYIVSLSTKRFSVAGNVCFVIDDNMRRRLETRLIRKILTFKLG